MGVNDNGLNTIILTKHHRLKCWDGTAVVYEIKKVDTDYFIEE